MTKTALGPGRVMQMAVPITDHERAKAFYLDVLGPGSFRSGRCRMGNNGSRERCRVTTRR